MNTELLNILRCPQTMQPLTEVDAGRLSQINERILNGSCVNQSGKSVSQKLDSGLITADGKILYPIWDGIPSMIFEESITMA